MQFRSSDHIVTRNLFASFVVYHAQSLHILCASSDYPNTALSLYNTDQGYSLTSDSSDMTFELDSEILRITLSNSKFPHMSACIELDINKSLSAEGSVRSIKLYDSDSLDSEKPLRDKRAPRMFASVDKIPLSYAVVHLLC